MKEWYKSAECEKALRMIENGYSIGRVAELLGIKHSQINYAKRLYGISNKATKFRKETEYKLPKELTALNLTKKEKAEKRIESALFNAGFQYVDGYTGKNSIITIRCWRCLETFTRYADRRFVSRVEDNGMECPCCAEIKKARQEERTKRKKYFAEQKRKKREQQKQERLNQVSTCKECGKKFTLAEYREKEQTEHCGLTVYCSSECRKKAERKNRRKYNVTHGKHKLRSIKYGVEFDKTVNLDDMLIRYGTKCALCGGECNINDYKIVNGARIYGDDYPSIDHIKPMSKGGSHTWDNVQVAHRGCNTRKGTNEVA